MNNVRRAMMFALVSLAFGCRSEAPTAIDNAGSSSALAPRKTGTNESPTFLQPAAGSPSLAELTTSFYAVQGQDRRVTMWYHADPGAADSAKLLEFRVRDKARIVRPDGTSLASGDSILITLTVIDPVKLIVDFQPSGLTFTGDDEPANLKMYYTEQNHDLNGDGVVNQKDTAIERTFAIYRRESVNDPWTRLTSDVVLSLDEVEAVIHGFTHYAIAY